MINRIGEVVEAISLADQSVIFPYNALVLETQTNSGIAVSLKNFREELARAVRWIGLRYDDPQLADFSFGSNLSATALGTPNFLMDEHRAAVQTFVDLQHVASIEFFNFDPNTLQPWPAPDREAIRAIFQVATIHLSSICRDNFLFEENHL